MKTATLENLRRLPIFDRRKAKRFPLHKSLYLDYRSCDEALGGFGRGENISRLGICFASSFAFSPGAHLDLRLRFSPYYGMDKSIRVRVRVAHCEIKFCQAHYRVGVAFEDVNSHFCNEIQAFLHWLHGSPKSLH